SALRLVVINGVPRFGESSLMKKLKASGETVKIEGATRTLFLTQATANAVVAKITLAEATSTLKQALKNLPNHKKKAGVFKPGAKKAMATRSAKGHEVWTLALDEIAPTGMDLRPHLPFDGESTMATPRGALLAPPKLQPLTLDPLTVADDDGFLNTLFAEK